MGQSRPLFVYLCYFLNTISIIQIQKSVDGVLGIQTWGRSMVGADLTTELWRPPSHYFTYLSFHLLMWLFFLRRDQTQHRPNQRTLTIGGRITVRLVSSLTRLELTNEWNMILFVFSEAVINATSCTVILPSKMSVLWFNESASKVCLRHGAL